MAMTIGDYKNQYAMYGAAATGMNNASVQQQKQGSEFIDFGNKSVEGIGGQAESGKVSGSNQYQASNLSFVQRLDKMDASNTLNHPETKSAVEGFQTGLGERLDLMG